MKRLSTALFATLLVSIALPVAAAPFCASVPVLNGGFILGVTGYYLRPTWTCDDLSFAVITDGINTFVDEIDTKYDWGYGINAGFIIPCSAIDIGLSFFHFDNTCHSKSVGITSAVNTFNFPLTDPAVIEPLNSHDASARMRYKIDQLGLAVGQFINFGCRFTAHPFIGARWAQLERRLTTTFGQSSTVTTTETIIQTQDLVFNENSRFNGIGPMAGMDSSYCLGCGWGIVGHFDAALLVGNTKESTNIVVTQITDLPGSVIDSADDFVELSPDHEQHVVPVIDLKLGLDYTFIFHCNSNSSMTLEAGWMSSYYFNSVNRLHTASTLENSNLGGGIAPIVSGANITGSSTSNIGLQGPYISLVFRM